MLFTLKNNILYLSEQPDGKRISDFAILPHPSQSSDYPLNTDLQHYLSGKRLLLDELPFPPETIHEHYQKGYITLQHGVTNSNKGYRCTRCANKDQGLFYSYACARCQKKCAYCRKCIMMGRVSECTPLFSWSGKHTVQQSSHASELTWNGILSKGQALASEKVVQAVQEKSNLLVWAVCGAGKTEVLFAGIQKALTLGQRVCIATPRTDVVLELAPRLQEVFPNMEVATLYGGSEDRSKNAPLTIATTHQLLRYYQAFDLLIIDEVDAFPYSIDATLEYAANQALKRIHTLVYLSATPSKKMQVSVKLNRLQAVMIPARYHRQKLPVPIFEWCGRWEKKVSKGKLPANVLYWVKRHVQQGRPLFLFVPDIKLLEKITAILQKEFGELVAGVHSKDTKRKEKVAEFRRGDIRVLVTTTILERGVTVENVQVGVLGAEDDVFTESALVQISGRAGRSKDFANGDVRFFHFGKTMEMVAARKQIVRMNVLARKEGLLDE
ncbi:Transcription-repair-coupling factor [Bacillus sp. THAF10]|uniref:DEAD/DEAH box helicase n=1 Tax=Bacillus sp. THAF10 TaxID=2587848 RepID=UPI001267D038|nr:DEAD/DEAH box helicase [Bacillus sp. THAF10]QFT90654.1 Transcription-repair-coupling factor [Bacillus sp. THAF10]